MQRLIERIPEAAALIDDQGRLIAFNRAAEESIDCQEIGALMDQIGAPSVACSERMIWTGRNGRMIVLMVQAEPVEWCGERGHLVTLRPDCPERSFDPTDSVMSPGWITAIDALEEIVLVVDEDLTIRHANQAAFAILGSDGEAVLEVPYYQLLHGSATVPSYLTSGELEAGGAPLVVELDEPHLGRFLRITVSRMVAGKAVGRHFVIVVKDQTSKRRQEQEAYRLNLALARSFSGITRALSDLVESRDPYTAGHSGGVAELAARIGVEMGFTEEEVEGLRVCAMLHDIGKASIPSSILNKPGKLSCYEWGMLKEHPVKAYEALRHIPFPWPVAEVVYQHHERLNGIGYPRGLEGDDIHVWARILAVSDVVDAMSKHRPYRPRLPLQEVLEELKKGRGSTYDARVVDVYIELLRREANRVMVVDDEPLMLDFVTQVLVLDGLDVAGFNDPSQALEVFEASPYPLVVTDLKMPTMDGFELIKRIRAINPNTEVIVITGSGDKRGAVEALRLGARDFLEKPMEIKTLQDAVKAALMHYRGRD